MSLATIQSTMGRRILGHTNAIAALSHTEQDSLTRLFACPGFRLTSAIQRSWCEGRAARGATLTLSALPSIYRKQLLADWVNQGGGTNSFLLAEAAAFLAFLKPQLTGHPHAYSLCCFEQAILRVLDATEDWQPATVTNRDTMLTTGRYASLINFFADPQVLLTAISKSESLPPVTNQPFPLFVAPGLPGHVRSADIEGFALWNDLIAPRSIHELLALGHSRELISDFANVGLIEPVQ